MAIIDERRSGTPIIPTAAIPTAAIPTAAIPTAAIPTAALASAKPEKRSMWFSVLTAGAALAAVIAAVAGLWTELGDSEITTAGWIALGIGVTMTTVVGVVLMALVFISNRRGWDEGH